MLKKLHDVLQLTISLLCILAAIAVMFSDIYNIDLHRLIIMAFLLSGTLGSLHFLLIYKTDKR